MKKGTQRGIYTALWLGVLGTGAYFIIKNYGSRITGALDNVFTAQGSSAASGGRTAAEPIYAERMEAAPASEPGRFDSMFSQLMGFKDDILRTLVPETVAGAVGPTGDPSSDTLLRKMFSDLKDYDAGMTSYLTYLQGEYIKPGGGSTGSGYSRGPSKLF